MEKKSKKIKKTAHIRGLEAEYVPHSAELGIDKKIFTSQAGVNVDTLYDTIKHSPEAIACIIAIIEDIMADGWRFIGDEKRISDAKKFEIQSIFFKEITNAIWELLLTGNAYLLKLSVDKKKIKTIVTALTKNLAESLKVKINQKQVYEYVKQDIEKPKDLQLLKSSTIKINFDETGLVQSYEQDVGHNKRIYNPEDIIHLNLYNIGGQPYGFTPLETLLSDIATLIFAKEFAGKYFENDGIPYFIFHMPDAKPGDRNYELLKKELKELRKTSNKYRSLVLTGNVSQEQVNKFNKDMEFSNLIQHFTQLILIAFGVPAHRINYTIDVKQVGGAVNRAYEGYYKKINFMQNIIQNQLNRDLWNNFNVEMKFKETYKIDEMREAQIVQIATQSGLVTVEEAREMMGLDPKMPKGTIPKALGDDKRIDFDRDQRAEQGREETPADHTDNKLKMIKSYSDALSVGWADFVKIVENKIGAGEFANANILYYETPEEFVLFFHDGNWRYTSRIPKSEIEVERFRLEKLRNAIKIKI
ncbi:MAG: phage portal protein [Promethearchaeota archaeon]